MKKVLCPILLLVFLLLGSAAARAQFDPDKVCRIENGELVFRLNLKWSEKEKKELIQLFDLDSTLIAQVYSGKKSVEANGESWKVKPLPNNWVELTKTLAPDKTPALDKLIDLFPIVDHWMAFGGNTPESPVTFGANSFDPVTAFVYRGGTAHFYFSGARNAKNVYISGTFNNWSTTQTPMKFTGNGWMIDLKLKPGKYDYKYIIDGRWTTDPANKLRERGDAGAYNSIVYCTNQVFKLSGYADARKVVVTGNFYGWNPRGLAMNHTSTGWELPVYLRDGTYAYKFLVDGKWMTDPANPSVRPDANGNMNSFLEIGEPYIFKLEGFTSAQKVILAGSFNNWNETELLMQKTAKGWQLPYVIAPGNYEYKFIADGEWMPDPANPFTTGSGDLTNSFIALKANHVFELDGNTEAKTVILTGSFNNWSRQDYRMINRGGKWIFPIYLAPGKYTYKFIVDGNWILDPANKLYEGNEYGTNNSVLWMEEGK